MEQTNVSSLINPAAGSDVWIGTQKTLELIFPDKENRMSFSAMDLGCLEGEYTVELARMGFNTVGLEVRQENIAKCNLNKTKFGFHNLNFVNDDARNIKQHGKFDVTLCYGLLYHLDKPVEFLKTLYDATNKVLLLHTHFAPEHDFRYSFPSLNRQIIARLERTFKTFHKRRNFYLSRISKNEGYKGRWMPEYNKNENKANIEKMLWSSYGNYQSFWLTKKELIKALYDIGFNIVFEQYAHVGDRTYKDYIDYQSRSMFVAIK